MNKSETGVNGRDHGSDAVRARKELKEKASVLKDEVKEVGALALSAAEETVQELKEGGRDSVSQMSDMFNEKTEVVRKFIVSSPLKSVLIGLGAGIALGCWATKKPNA